MCDSLRRFGINLCRKKEYNPDTHTSELQPCLNLMDLIFLSVGTMIGTGLYVTTGSVTKEAGPSIILGYLLAGLASFLSALCYAELGSRLPFSSSSYQAVYMLLGEVWAFAIGWNNTLEHAVGAASIASAISSYIDNMFGGVMRNYLSEHAHLFSGKYFASYVDVLAIGYLILVFALVGFGVKLSSWANILFSSANFVVATFIIVSAFIIGKSSNWTDSEHGGFFPNGFSATLSGSATLIYSYAGYEVIAAVSEEAVEPKRNIPLALITSFGIVIFLYIATTAAFVSIVPWYEVNVYAPFAYAYISAGWSWAKYVVTFGFIVGTVTCFIGVALAIARYFFAMARDGLLMSCFSKVNEKTKVPLNATIFGAVLCVTLVILFDLQELINFLSIGQLISCIFVAICVIHLRYKPLRRRPRIEQEVTTAETSNCDETTTLFRTVRENVETPLPEERTQIGRLQFLLDDTDFEWLLNWTERFEPGDFPLTLLYVAIVFVTISLGMFLHGGDFISSWWFVALSICCLFVATLALITMLLFKQDDNIDTYKVPLVPVLPFISIVINIALMMKLDVQTWVRLAVWLFIGFIMYFGYGYRHSKARQEGG